MDITSSSVYQAHRNYFGNLRSYEQYLLAVKNLERGTCPFCDVDHGINKPFSWHIPSLQGWLTPFPYKGTRVHAILFPKRHILHPRELNREEKEGLLDAVVWISDTYAIQGATLQMRYGDPDYTGASIPHLHAHVIAPNKGEEVTVHLSRTGSTLAAAQEQLRQWEAAYTASR